MCGRYSNSLWVERSGDRTPMRARYSAPSTPARGPAEPSVQWVPDLIPSALSGWCVSLTTHPHPSARLKKEYCCTATPLLVLQWPFLRLNLLLLLLPPKVTFDMGTFKCCRDYNKLTMLLGMIRGGSTIRGFDPAAMPRHEKVVNSVLFK